MIRQPIVGEHEHELEAEALELKIPTEQCPHCGAPRKDAVQYHKAQTNGARPWLVSWRCGSSVLLGSGRPLLNLSHRCTQVDM
jgi:hypothetical protein